MKFCKNISIKLDNDQKIKLRFPAEPIICTWDAAIYRANSKIYYKYIIEQDSRKTIFGKNNVDGSIDVKCIGRYQNVNTFIQKNYLYKNYHKMPTRMCCSIFIGSVYLLWNNLVKDKTGSNDWTGQDFLATMIFLSFTPTKYNKS